jgi:cytoskeletal protein CcmA (bactofilin family)
MSSKSKENGHNHIAAGTKINGEIESKGDLRIDGRISGSIVTQGKIVVGTEGYVEGNIKCKNADISGTVKADMDIEELIVLKETAKMNGNIVTKKISIEPGAEFSGNCKMGDKTSPNDGKKQK